MVKDRISWRLKDVKDFHKNKDKPWQENRGRNGETNVEEEVGKEGVMIGEEILVMQ